MKVDSGYRIERMGEQPEELRHLPCPNWGWVLVRNHDDEPMSAYGSKREAEIALKEMLDFQKELDAVKPESVEEMLSDISDYMAKHPKFAKRIDKMISAMEDDTAPTGEKEG